MKTYKLKKKTLLDHALFLPYPSRVTSGQRWSVRNGFSSLPNIDLHSFITKGRDVAEVQIFSRVFSYFFKSILFSKIRFASPQRPIRRCVTTFLSFKSIMSSINPSLMSLSSNYSYGMRGCTSFSSCAEEARRPRWGAV